VPVVVSEHAVTTTRKPVITKVSRRKRRKYTLKYEVTVEPAAYNANGVFYVHPVVLEALKRTLG
jgi:hypothetical protein